MKRTYRTGDAHTLAQERNYYDHYHGYYDSLAETDYDLILAHLPRDTRADSILEIGCGSGAFGKRLQNKLQSRINIGLDISLNLLKTYPFTPLLSNGQFLPFPMRVFDLVAACAALHHIHNLPHTLKEIARVLKPHGRVIFVEPNADHPYRRIVVDGGFLRSYFLQTSDESIFPEDLATLLRAVHFDNVYYTYVTFRYRHPSWLGKLQWLVSRVPRPRAWDRFVQPWFVLVAEKGTC